MRAQKSKKSLRKQDPSKNKEYAELLKNYRGKIYSLVLDSPFVLRVSRDRHGTLRLVAKERLVWMSGRENRFTGSYLLRRKKENRLAARGGLSGESALAFMPFIKKLVSRVNDNRGISLELHRFLSREGLRGNWSLPLNEEIGGKICLLFRLLGTMRDMGRMRLIACRIDTFSREEISYWLSRTTNMGVVYNRWAMAGLRLMLSGPSGNPHAEKALQKYLERK